MELGELLKKLTEGEASDLHIGAGQVPCFRKFGKIAPVSADIKPFAVKDVQNMIFRMLTQELQGRLQDEGELDFSFGIPGTGRFRGNIHRQRGTWAAVFRKIPSEVPTFMELGLPDITKQLAFKENGLLLVTGPSGSGKSMTLAAMVDAINVTRPCHIVTIEDPIEFVFKNRKAIVKQREVGTDTKDFQTALRHIQRQDPDVIVLGDIRDQETISKALSLAGTGRFVMGAIPTVDAVSTVNRILEFFPAEQQPLVQSQIAGCLLGIISQQLLLKSDGQGRVIATEVMISTPSIRNLIRTGKTYQVQNDIEVGKRFGMNSMNQALQELIVKGTVKLEEALRYTSQPDVLLQRVGVPQAK